MSVTAGTGGSPRNTRTVIGMVLFLAFLVAIPALGWSPSIALVCGLLVGIIFGNPFPQYTKPVTKYLLQASIVGLGFGININKVVAAGQEGICFHPIVAFGCDRFGLPARAAVSGGPCDQLPGVGWHRDLWRKRDAAVSQVVEADDQEVSISIGTFYPECYCLADLPPLGHWAEADAASIRHLGRDRHSRHQFGGRCGASYGNEALTVATTVKLARALWIVPLALLSAAIFKKKSSWVDFPGSSCFSCRLHAGFLGEHAADPAGRDRTQRKKRDSASPFS